MNIAQVHMQSVVDVCQWDIGSFQIACEMVKKISHYRYTFTLTRVRPMKKSMVSLVSALAIMATVHGPARADAGEAMEMVVKVPVALTAFTLGTIIGTPIAVLRKTFSNTVETTNQVAGEDGNPIAKAGGALIGLPVGIFTGSLEGLYLGPKNAVVGSGGDQPFSSETFSLGDLD